MHRSLAPALRLTLLLVCCSVSVHAEPKVSLPTERIVAPDPRAALRRALGSEASKLAEIEASLRQIKLLHRQLSEQSPDDPRLGELAKEIERLERQTAELWQKAERVARSASQPVSDETKAKTLARERARRRQETQKNSPTASR